MKVGQGKGKDDDKPNFVGNAYDAGKGMIIKIKADLIDDDLIAEIVTNRKTGEVNPVITLYVGDGPNGMWVSQMQTMEREEEMQQEKPKNSRFGKKGK